MTSWFAPRSFCAIRRLLLLPLLALFAAPAGAQGSSPAALITKMEDVYKNARSFQATITMKQSGKSRSGQAFSLSGTREVRFKAPNRVFDDQRYSGTGAAAQENRNSVLYVGDGKTLFVYQPASQKYAKRPSLPTVTLWQIVGRYMVIKSRFTFSMGTAAKVNGRDAYVVLAKLKIPTEFPPNVKPADKPKIIEEIKRQRPAQVFIDKHNYQLLRIIGGSSTVNDEINFTGQIVNGPIADSAFTFRVPAGAKLYTPPPGSPNPGANPNPIAPSPNR